MFDLLMELRQRIIGGGSIRMEEAERLLDLPEAQIPYLAGVGNEIRTHFKGAWVETCALANIKSGACSEDCKFCSQSAHYKTDSPVYGLINPENILAQAKEAEKRGATEFCMVTSGWGQTHEQEFEAVLESVRRISAETNLQVDVSLGFMTEEQIAKLKAAGLYRNNHNLEAARSYFDKVVSTHTYQERVDHVRMVEENGIHPCSGGIIGMGETPRQRLELAFELAAIHADCVPINILNPRSGTPFEKLEPIRPLEIIRTIALYRLILPHSTIKIAGGREVNLRDLQALALLAGANGLILGNYLTTMGRNAALDIQMLQDLGFDTSQKPPQESSAAGCGCGSRSSCRS